MSGESPVESTRTRLSPKGKGKGQIYFITQIFPSTEVSDKLFGCRISGLKYPVRGPVSKESRLSQKENKKVSFYFYYIIQTLFLCPGIANGLQLDVY